MGPRERGCGWLMQPASGGRKSRRRPPVAVALLLVLIVLLVAAAPVAAGTTHGRPGSTGSTGNTPATTNPYGEGGEGQNTATTVVPGSRSRRLIANFAPEGRSFTEPPAARDPPPASPGFEESSLPEPFPRMLTHNVGSVRQHLSRKFAGFI